MIDHAYSLRFLEKLNALQAKDAKFAKLFFYEKYTLWQSYQELLWGEIRLFSIEKKYTPPLPLTSSQRVKSSLVQLFIVLVSLLGVGSLLLFRPRVLIYSVDSAASPYKSDFRLLSLYRALEELHIPYSEIFHTVPGMKTLRHYVLRRRLAWYLEVSDVLYHVVGKFIFSSTSISQKELEEFDFSVYDTPDEKAFAQYLLKRYRARVELSRFRVALFSKIFAWSGLRIFAAIDDPRNYTELMIAARKAGVQTIAIQHGHFTKYHAGWLRKTEGEVAVPDALFVWSEYWRDELLRLGTYFKKGKIRVAGIPRELPSIPKREKRDTIGVLIPYETVCPKNEVALYINALSTSPTIKVFFKVRADMDVSLQLAEYGLQPHALPPRLSVVSSVEPLLSEIDVVLGTYSTLLYDMLAYGMPVAIMKTSSDYGEGMVQNGIAEFLNIAKDDPLQSLKRLSALSLKERLSRREQVFGKNPKLLHETLKEVIQASLSAQ